MAIINGRDTTKHFDVIRIQQVFHIQAGDNVVYKKLNSSGPRTDPCGTPDKAL
jgi:hypothetical protein